jgi:hypothetical protein
MFPILPWLFDLWLDFGPSNFPIQNPTTLPSKELEESLSNISRLARFIPETM